MWLAMALLAAVVAGVANGAATHTPQGNAQAAQTDAASLLASLNLPSGAVVQPAEPAGDDGTLAQPASGLPATPNAVDDHAWWVVPGTPSQVITYVKSHPPAGGAPGFSGGGSGGGKPPVIATGFQWSPIPDELSIRMLIVAAVRLADGSTGVRADSEVVWITPRPSAERIPPTARRVVVTTTHGGKVVQGPITVTARAKVAKIVSLLNALPAWQPGVYSCPADFGWQIRVAFYRLAGASRAAPLAVARVDPSGCGVVRLSLAGNPQPALADGYNLTRQLSAVIRVKLDSGGP
jgi:hypothetical protein